MDKMEHTPIEAQELRGVSLKSLYAIIVATAVIVTTVIGSYSSLKGEIKQIQSQSAGDAKYNELRMKTLEQQVDMNTMNIKDIRDQLIKQAK